MSRVQKKTSVSGGLEVDVNVILPVLPILAGFRCHQLAYMDPMGKCQTYGFKKSTTLGEFVFPLAGSLLAPQAEYLLLMLSRRDFCWGYVWRN